MTPLGLTALAVFWIVCGYIENVCDQAFWDGMLSDCPPPTHRERVAAYVLGPIGLAVGCSWRYANR